MSSSFGNFCFRLAPEVGIIAYHYPFAFLTSRLIDCVSKAMVYDRRISGADFEKKLGHTF
jgi:hypothetical protein